MCVCTCLYIYIYIYGHILLVSINNYICVCARIGFLHYVNRLLGVCVALVFSIVGVRVRVSGEDNDDMERSVSERATHNRIRKSMD